MALVNRSVYWLSWLGSSSSKLGVGGRILLISATNSCLMLSHLTCSVWYLKVESLILRVGMKAPSESVKVMALC